MHEDVPIIYMVQHYAYTTIGGAKNDIAILYLEYDVKITGNFFIIGKIEHRISHSF